MKLKDAAILIVDDEPVLCEIFAHWITAVGCRAVDTAADGEVALAILLAKHVDLLVTDIRMPKMDGVTLVRRLGGLGEQTPSIIFISGFGDVDQREMYALGVETFLFKPSRREELLGAMERALAERSALWAEPMRAAPRQTIRVQIEDRDKASFHLGRGGFSLCYVGRLSLGKVTFACTFLSEQRELNGQGYVRWRSKSDEAVGVEFSFIEPTCRDWVLGEIAATKPRSFIPDI